MRNHPVKTFLGWSALTLALAGFLTAASASAMSEDEFISQLQVAATSTDDDAGGSYTEADCSASCGSDPSVSVWCAGGCSAQDRNCAAYQRGYAQCNGGVKKYCSKTCKKPPVKCVARTVCPGNTTITCTGTQTCFGGDGLCLVSCDNVVTFCPGHQGQLVCDGGFGDPFYR